ncbi:PHO85 cyclin-1 [Hypsizygus marmoreus]|uniref:PHO85 cyclin-1 n=1 Tax=Hypsizygus marmoreus TaxID=39966 RepID=A0A369JYD1_HYPMA|nr:PHO85 cyclin-1 [Hypsizygus marmoreus]
MYAMNPADDTLYSTAKVIERFIVHLFKCSTTLPVPPSYPSSYKLAEYIAQVLWAAGVPSLSSHVLIGALILLNRLKERYPNANSPTGHQFIVPALMISAKFWDDHDVYSNRAWTVIAQQSATRREINLMEREMCQYLDWDFNMNMGLIRSFRTALMEDFSHYGSISRDYPIRTKNRWPTVKAAATISTLESQTAIANTYYTFTPWVVS